VIKIYLEKEEMKIIVIPDQIISLYYGTLTLEKNRKKICKNVVILTRLFLLCFYG